MMYKWLVKPGGVHYLSFRNFQFLYSFPYFLPKRFMFVFLNYLLNWFKLISYGVGVIYRGWFISYLNLKIPSKFNSYFIISTNVYNTCNLYRHSFKSLCTKMFWDCMKIDRILKHNSSIGKIKKKIPRYQDPFIDIFILEFLDSNTKLLYW